ncbi:atp-dependent RNA helicase ddx51 [Anaeramoeba ignava]|uniref:ATP-dependent RNA helicase n=1 Tax=Anaeramoeba ignava TaxID=1746090 RepID=A0A9Q0LWK9_ANAIG|nr:atp-dependent RNA helicase ddx51 [Anaeramoeba ignava]
MSSKKNRKHKKRKDLENLSEEKFDKKFKEKKNKKNENKNENEQNQEELDQNYTENIFEKINKETSQNENTNKNQTIRLPLWIRKGKSITTNLQEIDETKSKEVFFGVSPIIQETLREDFGITTLFPTQYEVIPSIMETIKNSHFLLSSNDICVQAPTGSGKTLAYVIPIIQSLLNRVIVRLRAVVLLPTRQLVLQVRNVFEKFCSRCSLKVVSSVGESSLTQSARMLIQNNESNNEKENQFANTSSKVDILICTPGRLMELLQNIPEFSLEDLRFLVIDEADRLLTQSYSDWLYRINTIIKSSQKTTSKTRTDLISVKKMIFTATLTKNPEKMSSLLLHNPLYFFASSNLRFKIPSSLQQYYIICQEEQKPLYLYALLERLSIQNKEQTLCFTGSVEATHRLFYLVKLMSKEKFKVQEYSSSLNSKKREEILKKFHRGEINVLVSSDIMARGMDIVGIQNVINYNAPTFVQNYIHRIGRTARAGRIGKTYTLVTQDTKSYFLRMIKRKIVHESPILKENINQNVISELEVDYENNLKKLKIMIDQENIATSNFSCVNNQDILKETIRKQLTKTIFN